jgi:hypothetical protein
LGALDGLVISGEIHEQAFRRSLTLKSDVCCAIG